MCWCMMSTHKKPLITLKIGVMNFCHRYTFMLEHICQQPMHKSVRCNFHLQANPTDREHFPFVLLGNKVDQEGGRTRVVSHAMCHLFDHIWGINL